LRQPLVSIRCGEGRVNPVGLDADSISWSARLTSGRKKTRREGRVNSPLS